MSRSKLLNKKKQSNFKIKNNASDLRFNKNGGVFNYDNNVSLRTGERATVTDRFQQAAEH